MKINISVKRKYKIKGKEYNSLEEMPDDVREIFKKTMGSQAGSGHEISAGVTRTKIFFNGREYDSIDEMPQDFRQLYEKVLQAAETGAAPPDIDVVGINSDVLMKPNAPGSTRPGENRKPTKIESSFSPRALIASVLLTALILLLYYLVKSR
jgi:hypothetical protein